MSVREGLYSQSSGLGAINKRVHQLTSLFLFFVTWSRWDFGEGSEFLNYCFPW